MPDVGESAPVVLVGRGGSGTRLLSRVALDADVFLGNRLNASLDSVEWVDPVYDLAVACLRGEPAAFEARLHARARDVLQRGGRGPDALWGWKLPETMLCLGAVFSAFPRARVVHLIRHPLTSSLRRTHVTSRLDNRVGRATLERAYRELGRDLALLEEDDDAIRNAASWAFQVGRVASLLRARTTPSLTVRYEDLCRDVDAFARALAERLGVGAFPPSSSIIDQSRLNPVDPNDARAQAVWALCAPIAEALGYEREPPRD